MKIDELIHLHNEALNRKADQNPFLNQRIKARLKERRYSILTKPVFVYGFIFILFTLLNFMLIDRLSEKTSLKPVPETAVKIDLTAFHPTFPGSIGKAYREVMK